MKALHVEPSKTAEWHTLVVEAEIQAGYQFEECLECYLVLTLDQFTTSDTLVSSVIAMDYLSAMEEQGQLASSLLRSVGDHCLLLSGLFPERAKRKNVTLDYFIQIGSKAYGLVATHEMLRASDPEVFYKLSQNFTGLMDVLHSMRDISNLPINYQ